MTSSTTARASRTTAPKAADRPAAAGLPAIGAPLSPGRKYLVGVSGGCDSMVLLHALVESGFRRLVVCHLNHKTRGRQSDADARFVAQAAQRLELPFELGEADVPAHAREERLSIEVAARHLRHAFFAACAHTHRCRRIVLAHHADDQIETCLHNFLRGTGAAGLAGMKTVTHIGPLEVLRPLLGISRDALRACAAANRIRFRHDSSNDYPGHTRNRLRHDVLPAIEAAVGPACRNAILRAGEILRAEDDWLESQVPEVSERLCCSALRALPLALRRRHVRRWLLSRGIAEAGFAETERVLTLLTMATAKVNLPDRHHARRRSGEIFLE